MLYVFISNVFYDNVKGIFNLKVKYLLKSINWINCNICKNYWLNVLEEYDVRYDIYFVEYNILSNL